MTPKKSWIACLRAGVLAFTLAGMAVPAIANAPEGHFDTLTLPRLPGAVTKYVNTWAMTTYTLDQPIAEVAQKALALLVADGWQEFRHPTTKRNLSPNVYNHDLKRGTSTIILGISFSSEEKIPQVTYQSKFLDYDRSFPFPKDGIDLRYDPLAPLLIVNSKSSVEATANFYRTEMTALGWKVEDGGASAADLRKQGGERIFFVRDNSQPASLILRRTGDETVIELKKMPPSVMAAAQAGQSTTSQRVAGGGDSALKPRGDKEDTEFDLMARKLMNEAMRPVAPRPPANAPRPADKVAAAPAGGSSLQPLSVGAPIPVPDVMSDLVINGERGSVEFKADAPVVDVANFYRNAMPKAGWKPATSVINNENMVVLNYTKGGKSLSITTMRMGPRTNVAASGSALVTAPPPERAADSRPSSRPTTSPISPGNARVSSLGPNPAQVPLDKLEVTERRGLPLPVPNGHIGDMRSMFRYEAMAGVPSSIDDVLAFYRRELGKRNWKEVPGSASVSAGKANVGYVSPDGPSLLSLERKGDLTEINLLVRKEADAKKSPLWPKSGRATLMFANIEDAEATVTLDKRSIKVRPGVGTQSPDGPSVDLAPGTYTFSVKAGSNPPRQDTVTIVAGEIWGVMLGPRGAPLTLQMY